MKRNEIENSESPAYYRIRIDKFYSKMIENVKTNENYSIFRTTFTVPVYTCILGIAKYKCIRFVRYQILCMFSDRFFRVAAVDWEFNFSFVFNSSSCFWLFIFSRCCCCCCCCLYHFMSVGWILYVWIRLNTEYRTPKHEYKLHCYELRTHFIEI